MQTSPQWSCEKNPAGNPERVHFVTRNFNDLLGLNTAWVGMVFLLLGLPMDYTWDLRSAFPTLRVVSGIDVVLCIGLVWGLLVVVARVALVVLFLPVLFRLNEVYREKFGIVNSKSPSSLVVLLCAYLAVRLLPLPSGPTACASFGLAWVVSGFLRPQVNRMALGLVFLGLATFHASLPPVMGNSHVSFILCGIAYMVCGLLDHRRLVKALGEVPEPTADELEAGEVAGGWRR